MILIINVYYHGTAGFKGFHCALNRIEAILKTGKISLNKYSNAMDAKYVSHGKRIYLSDPLKPALPKLDSAINLYISRGLSLVLDRKINIIEPSYSLTYENQNTEWTNLFDEVRAYEDISLEHLKAITLPIDLIIKKYQIDLLNYLNSKNVSSSVLKNIIRPNLELLNFMEKAFKAAKNFDSHLPIYDFLTKVIIDEDIFEAIKMIFNNQNSEIYSIKQLSIEKSQEL